MNAPVTPAPGALHLIEAEQALLGALLLNNELFDRVSAIVRAGDFFDPVHARIYEVISSRIASGDIASPVTLKPYFLDDTGIDQLGGVAYLVRLAGAASLYATEDHARMVADLARRRELDAALEETRLELLDLDVPVGAALARVETWSLAQEARNDSKIVSIASAAYRALTEAFEVKETGKRPGIPSGVSALDDLIGGFCKGQMIVLAGRPGMMKTGAALQFAMNAARAGHGVGFASIEMPDTELGLRSVSEEMARHGHMLAYKDVRDGLYDDADFEHMRAAAERLHGLPLKVLPSEIRSPGGLLSASRRLEKMLAREGHTLDLLIVDYLQIMEAASKGNANERVSELSNATKRLARRLDIPVVVLAQLNRSVESRDDKRPTISDLRDSGAIEQDADVIIFPFRQSYYTARERPDERDPEAMAEWQTAMSLQAGYMDLIVGKQRMGPTGNARALCDERTNWIRDTHVYRPPQRGKATPTATVEGFE